MQVKRDGTILSAGSSFLTGKIKAPKVVRRNQQLDAAEALRGVFEALNLPGNAANAEAVPVDSFSGAASDEFTISGVEGTLAVSSNIWTAYGFVPD